MLPAHLTEFRAYSHVEEFVKNHLSMQYEELRKLVMQPGYNFFLAASLCNIIGGLSVTLYQPKTAKYQPGSGRNKGKWVYLPGDKKGKGTTGTPVYLGTGVLFKMLLETFYPWQPEESGKKKLKAYYLYQFIRNPFAHALGVDETPDLEIGICRCESHPNGWSGDELEAIEASDDLTKVPVALCGSGKRWNLTVEHLYLAVFHILKRLAKDDGQMKRADKRIGGGQINWHKSC